MKTFGKTLLSIIVGLLLVGLIFTLVKLIIGLIVVVLLKIPLIGDLLSISWWFQDICIDIPAASIAYSITPTVMEAISKHSPRAKKISFITTGSILLVVHIISLIINIISIFMKLDGPEPITNIVNIIGSISLISNGKNVYIPNKVVSVKDNSDDYSF